ncbi:hypothetical protein A2U01_0108780, partial [Trifolium medium]|nr:hypothetical protein [Trifolium medium]
PSVLQNVDGISYHRFERSDTAEIGAGIGIGTGTQTDF